MLGVRRGVYVFRMDRTRRVLVALSLVVVAGTSACSSAAPYPWSEPGPAISEACADVDPSSDAAGSCLFVRDVWDFSQQDVVTEYLLIQARAEPLLRSDPSWTVDFASWDGTTPIKDYVASLNEAFVDWWSGPAQGTSGLGWDQGFYNEELLMNVDGTMTPMNPPRTVADVIDESKQAVRLVGDDLVLGNYNRAIGLAPGADQDIDVNSSMHVSGGVLTLDEDLGDGSGLEGYEYVLVLAGPPTETNGEVHGNTVVWHFDGQQTYTVLHAVGPIAN